MDSGTTWAALWDQDRSRCTRIRGRLDEVILVGGCRGSYTPCLVWGAFVPAAVAVDHTGVEWKDEKQVSFSLGWAPGPVLQLCLILFGGLLQLLPATNKLRASRQLSFGVV